MPLIKPIESGGILRPGWVCTACRCERRRVGRAGVATISQSSQPWRREQRVIWPPQLAPETLLASRTPLARCGYKTRSGGKLPNTPARTRFAPSPTGYLHIGGLRTALYSYLLAKRTGGQFVLRIEDTDQKRLVPDAESKIIADLRWAGLEWDEGPEIGGRHGPYRQSERTNIYARYASELIDLGPAYRCFCAPQSAKPNTNASYVTSFCHQDCASIAHSVSQDRATSETYTVRLHEPDDAGRQSYPDLIYGNIKRLTMLGPSLRQNPEGAVDATGTILVKSDGTPTYHFANVIDDHLMEITHVIRGTEWMASTPLHYNIYRAFGWEPPKFAHVGLLVDENQAKLSKRNQDLALDVASMREDHEVLPEVLNNFLALLGWSNPQSRDTMNMNELIQNFDLKFTRGNAMVKMEKLWYLQNQHIARHLKKDQGDEDFTSAKRRSGYSTAPAKNLQGILENINLMVRNTYPDFVVPSHYSSRENYLADIFKADKRLYSGAPGWVKRNSFFFHFDASQIPPPQETYNKAQTLKFAALQHFFHEYFSTHTSNDEPTIHNALVRQTCLAVLNIEALYPLDQPAETVPPDFCYFEAVMPDETPDVETVARAICADGTEDEVQGLIRRQKVYNTGAMKYARERLACGQPGPSISVMMAILGHEECCKRFGVEVHPKVAEQAQAEES